MLQLSLWKRVIIISITHLFLILIDIDKLIINKIHMLYQYKSCIFMHLCYNYIGFVFLCTCEKDYNCCFKYNKNVVFRTLSTCEI